MFTGIIETTGELIGSSAEGDNITFQIQSPISHELKIDQSVAHDGVCLTVIKTTGNIHFVTAIAETLEKTNLKNWAIGKKINLERCMPANGRFDGHIVQGHIDTTGHCIAVEEKQGSWQFTFSIDRQFSAYIVEKGSIALNGTSLTIFNVKEHQFSVAIIPYTYEHTTIHQVEKGTTVNVEFDIIGKYVARIQSVLN